MDILNYYTNQEAYEKICPEVHMINFKGSSLVRPLGVHCIGSKCADWEWHTELNDDGIAQGHCGKVVAEKK